jgi:hypothetical protein
LCKERTRVQLGAVPSSPRRYRFFVWFLATVASPARSAGPETRRAAAVTYGCGMIVITLFLTDVTSLAVRVLRPENMAAAPELATGTLHDLPVLVAKSERVPKGGSLIRDRLLHCTDRPVLVAVSCVRDH